MLTVIVEQGQQRNEGEEGVKLPSVFGNESDLGFPGQQNKQ